MGFSDCDSATSAEHASAPVPRLRATCPRDTKPSLTSYHFALVFTLASRASHPLPESDHGDARRPTAPLPLARASPPESQGHTRLWPAPSNSCFPLLCSKKQMPRGMVTVPRHRTAQPRRVLPSILASIPADAGRYLGAWSQQDRSSRHKNRSQHAESSAAGRENAARPSLSFHRGGCRCPEKDSRLSTAAVCQHRQPPTDTRQHLP